MNEFKHVLLTIKQLVDGYKTTMAAVVNCIKLQIPSICLFNSFYYVIWRFISFGQVVYFTSLPTTFSNQQHHWSISNWEINLDESNSLFLVTIGCQNAIMAAGDTCYKMMNGDINRPKMKENGIHKGMKNGHVVNNNAGDKVTKFQCYCLFTLLVVWFQAWSSGATG